MSIRQPKLKLPGKMPKAITKPEALAEPENGDLALHWKYIQLIFKNWNAYDPSELLEVSKWKNWIKYIAKSENKVKLFTDENMLTSFAEVLVELICDQDQEDPLRHKLLCSKLNDKQMKELSKLIEIREKRECAMLLAKEDTLLLEGESYCWNPVLEHGDPDVAFIEDKYGEKRKDGNSSPDLLFGGTGTSFMELRNKKRIKRRKTMKLPVKEMAVAKEVSVDNPAPQCSPPHSPPSLPTIRIKASYNDGLEGEMGKLEIGGGNLPIKSAKGKDREAGLSEGQGQDKGHQDQEDERIKKVIALKYPRPSEDAPELTPEMFGVLTQALMRSSPEQCLSEFNGLKYSRKDLAVLNNGTEWLNDRNIDFYLELIKERSRNSDGFLKVYVFHCFFYVMLTDKDCSFAVLSEATGDEDLAKFDLVFFPVNLNHHWRLVVADFRNTSLKCYDSMGSHQQNEEVLNTVLKYLKREFQRRNKKGHLVFFRCWLLEIVEEEDIPQQGNGIDCGVFLLQFAEYLSRGEKYFDFEQKHVPYFRKKMMYETLTKRILPQQNANQMQ